VVARPIFEVLFNRQKTPKEFKVLADGGFIDKYLKAKVVCPRKRDQYSKHAAARARQKAADALIIQVRQAAEWGNRALQGSFSRLKTHLPENDRKRAQLLRVVVRLYNLRVRWIGINQLKAVFVDPLGIASGSDSDSDSPDRVRMFYNIPDSDDSDV